MTDLVLTLIGPDRPGLVEAVASVVASHGGNWVESRMTQLAGKFAGILRAEVPADRVDGALRDLAGLETRGLRLVVEATADVPPPATAMTKMILELTGLDQPGIVREIAQLLARNGVNVEELTTNRASAPMSGEMLFQAQARVAVPVTTDVVSLRAALEQAGADLVVDVKLEPPPGTLGGG